MALILVKEGLLEFARTIARDGYEARCGGINVRFAPQYSTVYRYHGNVHDHVINETNQFSMTLSGITLIDDVYDRIPLADKALLANPKIFYDDPALIERLTRKDIMTYLRLASMPISHQISDRGEPLGPVQIVPEPEIHACAFGGTPAHMTNGVVCLDASGETWCVDHAISEPFRAIKVIRGTLESLTPPSLVARFLLDQMAREFSIDVLSFPDEFQFVFLIGHEFYISAQPIRASDRAQYYGARKRLRITTRVSRDLFQPHQARNHPDPKAAFDEFMSEAH